MVLLSLSRRQVKNHQGVTAGKCGVCGDPYNETQDHDDNGRFASGIIVRSYQEGLYVNITFFTSGRTLGYVEFRLCPRNSTDYSLNQMCFDMFPLWIVESDSLRFYLGSRGGIYDVHVLLPSGISCEKCVLQWTYVQGFPSASDSKNCTCINDFYEREQFVNCADVEILPQPKRTDESTTATIGLFPEIITESVQHGSTHINSTIIPQLKSMATRTDQIGSTLTSGKSLLTSTGLTQSLHAPITLSTPLSLHPSTEIFRKSDSKVFFSIPSDQKETTTFAMKSLTSVDRRVTSETVPFFSHSGQASTTHIDLRYPYLSFPLLSHRTHIPRPFLIGGDLSEGTKRWSCDIYSDKFRCNGIGLYQQSEGIESWCTMNCRSGNCAHFMCFCSCDETINITSSCSARSEFRSVAGMDDWCAANCKVGYCPAIVCNVADCLAVNADQTNSNVEN
ncbi:hypothetical protein CHS0354_008435 [Potamilus streckersoni]|uniref:Chitin-binding type-4 domain-containing protein n=1 Tax=Potamilus streckersoni TaxID=2493646 RepID=A0AAE0RPP8_9BIVA|nr:hypothetical protein CHS0354_008435 [Potamilus streckersoni]